MTIKNWMGLALVGTCCFLGGVGAAVVGLTLAAKYDLL